MKNLSADERIAIIEKVEQLLADGETPSGGTVSNDSNSLRKVVKDL